MNVRLDPLILESLMSSEPSPRCLLPEEPIFGYVARRAKLSVTRSPESIAEELIPKGGHAIHRPLHAGLGQFAEHAFGSGHHADQLVAGHGLITLYQPFLEPKRLAQVWALIKGAPPGIKFLPTSRCSGEIFRSTPAVCLACVAADLAARGFAHYRRGHIIKAVSHCAEHQEALVEKCPHCATTFSRWELPSLICQNCHRPLDSTDRGGQSDEHAEAKIRLSRFIAAALAGNLQSIDANRRLAVYRQRTAQIIRTRSGVIGDNLARHLKNTFGLDFLDQLGLAPSHPPSLGWPALFVHGRILVDDPIANCLVLAALFDSPAQYAQFGVSLGHALPATPAPAKPLYCAQRITASLLRDVLSTATLRSVVSKHNLDFSNVKCWIAGYPGLSDRRAAILHRAKLEMHKRTLLELKATCPKVSQGKLERARRGAFNFTRRHDPQWLDRVFPKRFLRSDRRRFAQDSGRSLDSTLPVAART
jgi:hypothetical protein